MSADGAEMYSCFVGESESLVRSLFKEAKARSPCMVFLDEVDSLVGTRNAGGGGMCGSSGGAGPSQKDVVQERILSTLLNEMDGIEPLHGVVVVAATNRIDAIDAALLRPGRFDRLIYVPLPNTEARKSIFRLYIAQMPTGADPIIDDLASLSEGFSGADCKRVCQEAALLALRENLSAECVVDSFFIFLGTETL